MGKWVKAGNASVVLGFKLGAQLCQSRQEPWDINVGLVRRVCEQSPPVLSQRG